EKRSGTGEGHVGRPRPHRRPPAAPSYSPRSKSSNRQGDQPSLPDIANGQPPSTRRPRSALVRVDTRVRAVGPEGEERMWQRYCTLIGGVLLVGGLLGARHLNHVEAIAVSARTELYERSRAKRFGNTRREYRW